MGFQKETKIKIFLHFYYCKESQRPITSSPCVGKISEQVFSSLMKFLHLPNNEEFESNPCTTKISLCQLCKTQISDPYDPVRCFYLCILC
ncbi:hypothetical protein X975_02675, partial [Stegodyphus mimosarum]